MPLLWLVAGCQSPMNSKPAIQSLDANDRILAIRAAADANDRAAIPLIVDRLEDEDSAVRFYAILALERMTGKRFGYDYAGPLADRNRAVDKWREYVRQSSPRTAEVRHAEQPRTAADSPEPAGTARAPHERQNAR